MDLHWSPAFGLDEHQRILFWSQDAEAELGIAATQAVGRSCDEVLQGRDYFGRPYCRKACPAFLSLLNGRLQSHCALEIVREARQASRVKWRLLALPPGSSPRAMAFFGEQSPGLVRLAHMGYVSSALSASPQLEALPEVLRWIAESTDMEVAELFLLDQQTGQMVLTGQQGPFVSAFRQITQFPIGEGYPGLVAAGGEPIVTDDLPHDERYLRTKVKESGFTGYICVPLVGPDGVLGALNVATRRRHEDLHSILSLLEGLSRPLSAAIAAALLRARDSVAGFEAQPTGDIQWNRELLLLQTLAKMVVASGACSGAIVLRDATNGSVNLRVADGELAYQPLCDLPPNVRCPAFEPRNVILGGHRSDWPGACRAASLRGGPTVCLPLAADGAVLGVVSLRYRAAMPLPATRHFGVLSAMAHRAALLVCNLNIYQKAADTAAAAERERLLDALKRGTTPNGPSQRRQEGDGGASPAGPAGETFLEIRCLGDFRVYRNGELIAPRAFSRRQALTALKILALHAGRKVPKDVLVEFLWPGTEPEAGADRLFVVMHALRQVLEPQNGAPWRFVQTDGDSYYLNLDAPCRIDVEEFRDGVRRGQEIERQGNAPQALAVYQAAAQLYQGDFMRDEPYSDWCWAEREFLRETYLDLVKKVAFLLREEGDLESAILYYRQALQADPLREEMQRYLMRCLWQAGRADEALRQYAAFRQRLQQELDIEPLPETRELYETIARR